VIFGFFFNCQSRQ